MAALTIANYVARLDDGQDFLAVRDKANPNQTTKGERMRTEINLPAKLLDYLNEARSGLPPVTDPDQPLQIDSLGLIRLVAFLESDLHIKIEDDELLADNFATPRALSNLLAGKLAGGKDPDVAEEA